MSTVDDNGDDIYDPTTADVSDYEFAGYFALKPPNDEIIPPTRAGSNAPNESSAIMEGADKDNEEK